MTSSSAADVMQAAASVLVLVDFQGRLLPAIEAGADAVARAVLLARAAHILDVPVLGTEQNPDGLGPNVAELKTLCARTLAKTHFDACADGLVDAVRAARAERGRTDAAPDAQRDGHAPIDAATGRARASRQPGAQDDAGADAQRDAMAGTQIVVAGCETHVCLLQTALGLLRAGLRVWVVADACGSRHAADHNAALRRLAQAGALVVTAEMVIFEWLHDCRQPRFREVLALIKANI